MSLSPMNNRIACRTDVIAKLANSYVRAPLVTASMYDFPPIQSPHPALDPQTSSKHNNGKAPLCAASKTSKMLGCNPKAAMCSHKRA